MKSFSRLPLSPAMENNLMEMGYISMTPIQEASIEPILKGADVLAQARTGSGKTAAFGIGLLQNLNVRRFRIQALVLCPTRELAEQVSEELRKIARFQHNIKIMKITGGLPLYKQEHSLGHQAHIVVGTPGRVLKLLERGSLSLREVRTLVLDEADRMLDMGFIDQINSIISFAPVRRQTLCFSATFPDDVKKLSRSIQNNPLELTVDKEHDPSVIAQHFYHGANRDKGQAVLSLLSHFRPENVIIFCNTKEVCRKVNRELTEAGLHSLSLNGDLEQKERTEVLIRFANGSCNVLVATDVAARGLDIKSLGAVINYDLPYEKETYVHRIGRTGRAGEEGLALSLVVPGEEFRLDGISPRFEDLPEPGMSGPSFPDPAMITLSINGGRKNKISAGDVLGALTCEGGISGDDVGKIDRQDYLTFIAVKRDKAPEALALLEKGPVKGRRFKAIVND
ncbi:MAG: ATP-dependent RNA helicase DbpA [Spirochaetales bacterium]|nr:ATP-dependent RNA helicase DbpA [Spirochaetales bacterium]